MPAQAPTLSVVIPTMGRAILFQTLTSLCEARGNERIEIIVVGVIPDEQILSRVQALVRNDPRFTHLAVRYPVGDASEKRNAGFRASRADIVAFIDDDVYLPPHWIERVLQAFAPPDVGMVSGPSLVPADISLLARLAGLALSSRAAGYVAHRYIKGQEAVKRVKWSRTIGCNMIFRRSALEEVNGFHPDFYPGEEMIAAHGVAGHGHALVFDSEAYVYHYPKTTFRGFWRQIFRYGATRVRLMRAGLDVEWTPLVPAAWVLSLVILGLGAFVNGWLRWLLWADLAAYGGVALLITLGVYAETRRASDLLLLLIQPFMHIAYGVGIWAEVFLPDKDLGDALGKPTT